MVTTRPLALVAAALALVATLALAQQAPDFAGTWTASLPDGGTGTFKLEQQPDGKVKGTYERSDSPGAVPVEGGVRPDRVLQADMIAPDGQRYRWEGRLAPDGQALTATIFLPGEEPRDQVFRRAPAGGGEPPPDPLGQPRNPLGGGGPPNPLAAPPPPPAWAATWADGQVKLVLAPAAGDAGAFQGTITVQGATYPVKGRSGAPKLVGTFAVQGHDFPFTATLQGEVLTLVSEGTTYTLRKERPAQPTNPLGNPGPATGAGGPTSPGPAPGPQGAALTDVYDGPAQPLRHAGGFSLDLPQGWTVQQEQEGVLVISAGAGANNTLEAMALVAHGELEPEERGKSAVQHLVDDGPSVCEGFGLMQPRAAGEPRALTIHGVPGAEGTWTGTLQNGVPATVWTGAVITGERFVVVAIVVQQGREQAYLPKARRMLASTRLN